MEVSKDLELINKADIVLLAHKILKGKGYFGSPFKSKKICSGKILKCTDCPRCKDSLDNPLDKDGYHRYICSNGGNIVYKEPHRIKRIKGKGYLKFDASSCGLYESIEDALWSMTDIEIIRWKDNIIQLSK